MRKNLYNFITWGNISFIVFLCFLMFLSGCGAHTAVNRTENYINAWPNINYISDKNIVIGIIDERSYVVNGSVKPAYVGLMRGGFYNPWHMNTESGKPLVEDLSQAIVSGFKNAGINAKYIILTSDMDQQKLYNYFLSNNSSKKVLIRIQEWQSDTFSSTVFMYDLTAEIYNEDGVMVAKCTEKNVNENGENQTVVSPVDAGRNILTKILNTKSIITALQ